MNRKNKPTAPALRRYIPLLDWGRDYTSRTLSADMLAAAIVTIMLIPQSLAYAMLAGLPPQAGLYASILPLIAYGIFGTSRVLAVGPVAVISLMTASTIGSLGLGNPLEYAYAAAFLALLSGGILLLMGFLKLGFLANFLSHPVISGFITASGLLIAASQLKHILGVPASGHSLIEIGRTLWAGLPYTNTSALLIGIASLAFLFWIRSGLKRLLTRAGAPPGLTAFLVKTGPIGAVVLATWLAWRYQLQHQGLDVVSNIPRGLPDSGLPALDHIAWKDLLLPALMISIIGFVESVSVAQTLAAKKRQRIAPNQELIGLGAANIASGLSAGYPVTGGFARSVVNYDAGAETPAAGIFTAGGITLATLFLTPLLYHLPKATLAATIMIAVLSLVDFSILKRTWHYSKADFAAVAGTIAVTLGAGVEYGISAGVALSVLLFLYKTACPHIAEVGLVPGTEHFRNIHRHSVLTAPHIITLRVDESLYFANARYLEDAIYDRVVDAPEIRHFILQCTAINEIDSSALESLEAINHRLDGLGIKLHFSEVKGPVMDRLLRTELPGCLTGRIFLSQYEAVRSLGGLDGSTRPPVFPTGDRLNRPKEKATG